MVPVSTLTTTHRDHKIEIARFEWGYTARISALKYGGKFTVAGASAWRALADAVALIDHWTVPAVGKAGAQV